MEVTTTNRRQLWTTAELAREIGSTIDFVERVLSRERIEPEDRHSCRYGLVALKECRRQLRMIEKQI